MVKFRKAFIVLGATFIITALCATNKGFSAVQKQGFLLEDTMLTSKDGSSLYYACKGEDVTVQHIFNDGTCYVSVNNNQGYILENSITYGKVSYPTICKGDGVNKGIVDEVNKQLLIIPDNLRKLFQESGWSMVATNEDLNEKYYNGEFNSVSGSTSYKEHEVSISDSEEAAEDATLHEFGHWFNWYLNYPSNSEVFLEIYNKENKTFYSEFNLSIHWDEREFFAEGFDRFYTDRLKLESVSPELYSYMSTILHNLS